MDPLEWMGAVQTADKNITVIHTTPVHQLMHCEVKSPVFIMNKTITMIFFFIFKPLIRNLLYIILLSPVSTLSCLNQERNMHRSSTVYRWKQFKTVLNKYVCGFWCARTTEDILFHWRKLYYKLWTNMLVRIGVLKSKHIDGFVSCKHIAFGFLRC